MQKTTKAAIILLLFLSSCYSSRSIIYVNNSEFNTEKPVMVETQKRVYKLQPFDIVGIQVRDLAGKTTDILSAQQGGNMAMFPNEYTMYLSSYPIDDLGNINFPTLGSIQVAGLTINEVQEKIVKLASEYYKNPIVSARLVSFRISILGQVRNPGRFLIGSEQANILEAMALAGDVAEFASRKIKLIRYNGKYEEVILIDLTDSKLLSSPYYYLQPNDKIIVTPMRAKIRRDNLGLLGTAFSAITTIILLLNYINK
jgi:polysaccharide export outer membrane protein